MKIPKLYINLASLVFSLISLGLVFYQRPLVDAFLSSQVAIIDDDLDSEAYLTGLEYIAKINPNAPVLGDQNAPVTIVEFGDYQCVFCKKFFDTIYKEVILEHVEKGEVKFVYLNYPFLGEGSILGAEGGYCAEEQGAFWPYHDYVYEHRNDVKDKQPFQISDLARFAKSLPLDADKLMECLQTHKYQSRVKTELAIAREHKVNGTPLVFIGDDAYQGLQTLDIYKHAIKEAILDSK